MKAPLVRLAFLSEYAAVRKGGRFEVVGAGIRSLSFRSYPATVERLSVAIVLEFAADQLPGPGQSVLLEVIPRGPSGLLPVPRAISVVQPRPLLPDGSISAFELVVNLAAVKLEEVGEYEFAITYQGEELTYLPLLAQLDTSTPTIEATPWDTQLRLGYEVFQRGQAEPARKVFEEFTRSFPSIPDGWNNLGFVQLDMGLARQAETSFERARDLGYLKPEIMSMNLGCAYYAQERFDEAVTAFREALGAGRFAGPAILHAITQAGLHSVDVPDVRAFIGLGLVNESWTEFRLGEFRLSRSSVDAAIQLASDAATELPRWLKEAAEDLSDLIERSSNPE